jgi:hypothetical protein
MLMFFLNSVERLSCNHRPKSRAKFGAKYSHAANLPEKDNNTDNNTDNKCVTNMIIVHFREPRRNVFPGLIKIFCLFIFELARP